ncbi:MAG: hypothetical protein WBP75_11750 [Candidatus Cybelea sp.]
MPDARGDDERLLLAGVTERLLFLSLLFLSAPASVVALSVTRIGIDDSPQPASNIAAMPALSAHPPNRKLFISPAPPEALRDQLLSTFVVAKGKARTLSLSGGLENLDERSKSCFTGDSILAELRYRGDEEAIAILGLLETNDKMALKV